MLVTLELESVEISMGNLLELVKASKVLSELRLSHVDLIGTEKNSAVIKALSKFQSEMKCLYVSECSESITSFIHILPCHDIEFLIIRAKNIDNLRRFIQKNKSLKSLDLQLTERKDPLPRDLLNEIELTHLKILLNNKDNLDPIIEHQTKLKHLSTNAKLSKNLVKKISNFSNIEELSFRGDKIDHDDLQTLASCESLKTVKIEFKLSVPPVMIVDVLSVFFKNSFKYSTHSSESCSKNFYKLSKAHIISSKSKMQVNPKITVTEIKSETCESPRQCSINLDQNSVFHE